MKPVSIPALLLIGALATVFGAMMLDAFASRGVPVPVTGWLTAALLLVLSGVLLSFGLPLRRYMRESEERRQQAALTPRRHQLDLPTAYRTVLLARACAYTGALVGGIFTGQVLYFLSSGGGDPVAAVLPTAAAAVAGIILGVLGVVVERWGKLPPQDGPGATEGAGAGS